MENAYGIGVTNRYALFLDEDAEDVDPLDILKQSEEEKLKNKKVAVAKDDKKGPVKKTDSAPKKTNDGDKENRNNRFEGKRVLDARKAQEGPTDRVEKNNARNQEGGRPDNRENRGEGGRDARGGGRGRGEGGRGRGGGEGRGRGGGGGGGARGGRREFDRKSGDDKTGIKQEDKRGGTGKGNWGTYEDDLNTTEEAIANTSVEEVAAPVEGEEKPAAAEEGEKVVEPEVEKEPETMTLEEYKAMQGKKEGPKFNLRKAGEGASIDPMWKKATAYKREKEGGEEEEEEGEDTVRDVEWNQRSNRQKRILDINFTFADQNQGRGGRGGRGRGEGRGRGRGGDRGGDRGGRGGDRDGGERRERPPRQERPEGGEAGGEGAPPPRRGGYGGDREDRGDWPPRRGGEGRGGRGSGGRGGGGRGGRGGQNREFNLDNEAFPTLG